MSENLMLNQVLQPILFVIIGIACGALLYHLRLRKSKSSVKQLVENAEREAEKIKKDHLYKFKMDMHQQRSKFQNELKQKEENQNRLENKLLAKEKELRKEENNMRIKQSRIENKEKKINELEEILYEKHKKADVIIEEQNKKLERISSMKIEEAKQQLLKNLENKVKLEAVQMANDIREEAKEKAQREAKELIANAIENLAYDFTMESTLSTVELPNERFKGMIIGREGRNIRAFEEATDVKVIVDDTPELVVLSGFDPVAREIARNAMENLIKSKNINVNSIQQAVHKAKKEVDRSIQRAAEDTLRELRIYDVHPLMKENLGRLKYRYSYGQNMLMHSKEVAYISGKLAAELGFNVKLARRAGLFHDIGKSVSNNSEGSHVSLGVELAKKCREHEVVINSILAHHEEAEPISPISILVTAADRISGSRPGARRDTLEAYTKRITKLEEIANSFDGVSKTYAISAGREIRVIVEPDRIQDAQAQVLSSDIANKIKESMEFPGQIKV
ncbi:MAG: ribonuclease Y, partial [Calditrichaceae bacterium]